MKILFAGDYITYTPPVLRFLKESSKPGELFGDLAPWLSESDASVYNQELPLTTATRPFPAKTFGPLLKADPSCIAAPAQAGFTHATLAANHTYNFGDAGLQQTLETCREHAVTPFGAGLSLEEARKPVFVEKNGVRVALLNFAENEYNTANASHGGAAPLDVIDNVRQIRELREHADHVVVIIHGGTDFCHYPSPRTVKQYRFYAEQGASAVIGHHTHVVSGWEIHQGSPILYGVGNLIPGRIVVPGSQYTWPVQFTFGRDGLSFEGLPLKLDYSKMRLRRLTTDEAEAFDRQQNAVNAAIADEALLAKQWGAFLDTTEREAAYFTWLTGVNYLPFRIAKKFRPLLPLYRNWVRRRATRGARSGALWNLLRCETHRDVLAHYYETYIDRT